MENNSHKFQYPADIELKSHPLIEAWLQIRWQLESDLPNFQRDPSFPFALGAFYFSVKDKFKYREDLDASRAPEGLLPYVVRHRFRTEQDKWPVLQLGPGVATLNFTEPYTWTDFKNMALYLREKLLNAYSETGLIAQGLSLRYRNGLPFEYTSSDLFEFLEQKLNTSIVLPSPIPGDISSTPWPVGAKIELTYNLQEPKATGKLVLATGLNKDSETKKEVLVWELEVRSEGDDLPEFDNEDEFTQWLISAHAVIHEWFFSLIDGSLREKFESEAGQ